MKENFDKYEVPDLKVLEGGNVDDPRDPGGRTGKGVTQRTYNAYRRSKKLPTADVFNITQQEWYDIMRSQYWAAVRGDDMPAGVDVVLSDQAVNSGAGRSIMWLQGALGVTADGVIGPATMNAVNACDDYDLLIGKMCDLRLNFMRNLKTWKVYKNGWTSRVAHMRQRGQALATGSVGRDPIAIPGTQAKALITDAKPAPSKSLGDATGTGGVIGVVIPQVQSTLAPVASWEPISHILTYISVAAGLIAIAGFVWSIYARKKEKERNDALQIQSAPNVPVEAPEQSFPDPDANVAAPVMAPRTLTMNADTGYIGVDGKPMGG